MAKRSSGQPSKFSELMRQVEPAAAPVVKERALAKSKDPEYTKVTVYLRKDTHMKVKRKLLDQGDAEFSGQVEQLLVAWLDAG